MSDELLHTPLTHGQKVSLGVVVGVAVTVIAATIIGTFIMMLDVRISIAEQTVELRGINTRLGSTVSVDIFSASQTSTHARIGVNADDIGDLWTSHAALRKELQDHEH